MSYDAAVTRDARSVLAVLLVILAVAGGRLWAMGRGVSVGDYGTAVTRWWAEMAR